MGDHCAQAARSPWVWPETRDGQESWRVGQAAGEYAPEGLVQRVRGPAALIDAAVQNPRHFPVLGAQGRMCCWNSIRGGNADCAATHWV